MKRIIALFLVLSLITCFTACTDNSKTEIATNDESETVTVRETLPTTAVETVDSNQYKKSIISAIIKNQSEWYNNYIYEFGFFDLDNDGNLEFIINYIGAGSATSMYTYENDLERINNNYIMKDGSSVEDNIYNDCLSISIAGAYYNDDQKQYSVSVMCLSQEPAETKNASGELFFDGTDCQTKFFAMKVISPSGIQYYDGSNGYLDITGMNAIEQVEYDSIIENKNRIAVTISEKRITPDKWKTANTEQKRSLLEESYDAFSITLPSEKETTVEESPETDYSDELFSQLTQQFIFTSGAGAWNTYLNIHSDGSFDGNFHDSDMGAKGSDYPNGTIYYCDFSGRFGEVKKIDDTTYSMKMLEINYANVPDTEEIKNGQKYIYSTAYGLDEADEVIVYLPNTPVDGLPDGFVNWTSRLQPYDENTIGYYGLYNVNEEEGFLTSNYN